MAHMMNQNWSGSSLPTPLNTGNFIVLSILARDGGEGGMGEDGGVGGEPCGGVGRRWYAWNPLPYQIDHT